MTGRVGEIGLQCIFFCSLRGASCPALKTHPAERLDDERVEESPASESRAVYSGGTIICVNKSVAFHQKNTHTHTHTLLSKLTPVSGWAVQANSVVAHFVSISVSVNTSRKKTTRSDTKRDGGCGGHQ